MQFRVIGLGGAGCRIADTLHNVAEAGSSFIETAFAFDTDSESLTSLSSIPEERRIRYAHHVENGLAGDLQAGMTVGTESVTELSRELDAGQPTSVDAFLIVLGFGGATGGGTARALISNLKTLYAKPVYVLGTLPVVEAPSPDAREVRTSADTPSDRQQLASNTLRTLETLSGTADAIICFDTKAWLRRSETVAAGRDRINQELATRVASFFGAVGASTAAETVIDANDVSRILGTETGFATLGYGSQQIEPAESDSRFGLGLFSSTPTVDTTTAISAIETVIGKALHGKLTLECKRAAADRALLVVGGPPAWLNRQAIADGRALLESTVDSATVLSGDAPQPDTGQVFAAVLLADIGSLSRLEEIRSVAESESA